MKRILHKGDRFSRLTFIEELPSDKKHRRGLFSCDCGENKVMRLCGVINGSIRSCGRLQSENASKCNKKHGMKKTREYNSWDSMIQRCENTKNDRYYDYGGRGITVCERWHDFSEFYADMGDRPEGATLDRINNSLGYSPENCRWSTLSEQQSNRRKYKGSASKYVGVFLRPSGRWMSTITTNGKSTYLGDFDTEEEASDAYQAAKSKREEDFEARRKLRGW
ncbi:AP2 domain-containing protein [Salmonella enterica]|nr:AP2 domain-containing protein [Salmonella enterica]EDT6448162.1 AP2 domain-containing protein [Salmonella enterica subsp. enterica]